jgi:hypothetical protein
MSIVSKIGEVINKMTVANSIDYFIVEREFANLLSASKDYQVFIDAPLVSEGTVNSGVFLRTYQVKMLWLRKQPLGNTYAQHYDNAITTMRTLVKEFILRLNNEKDNVTQAAIFEPVTQVRETDLINLFDQNTSGVLIEFNLKVINDNSICTPNLLPPPSVYLFADLTTVVSGTQIRLGWIAFNVDTITIDNGIGTVSAVGSTLVTIDSNITFTATAINANGTATDTITITISSACLDATAVLKDEDGNVISTTNIPSGDSQDIEAPNADYLVEYLNGTPIQSGEILSGGSVVVQVPNPIVCADATAELFNTNGNLLSTTPIPSGATEPIIAPDATILINGDNSFPTIPSGGLENIVVENTQGTPVGAYDGNSNSWVLPDTTYQINVNGNPIAPFDLPTLENNTININWTY